MGKKVIKHERYQTCKLSKEKIDTEKEQYVILVDCLKDDVVSFNFYKLKYLKELFTGNAKNLTDNVMGRIQNMAGGMMERVGLTKQEVEIK